MKDIHKLLREISQLSTTIETNYPELYCSLDENPMTIPTNDHMHVDKKIMQEYLESLKQLLSHHVEMHKNK